MAFNPVVLVRFAASDARRFALLASLGMGVFSLSACDMLMGSKGPEIADPAKATLKSGDLPGASTQFQQLASENPGHVEAAIGFAYTQLLRGDYAGADATLAGVEEKAGERLGEVKLRRAIVALRAGDLDAVKAHGTASGTPEGKLLAAEVNLVDLEADVALAKLREVQSAGGAVGETAGKYLALLESNDQVKAGMAEATALWALGDRKAACEAAQELVSSIEDDGSGDRSRQVLLWAGRAVTSGLPGVATALLDDIGSPPPDQAWRVQATRGMIMASQGNTDGAAKLFQQLESGGAPLDGLADARATAAALMEDRAAAKQLVDGLESSAAARSLLQAQAPVAAQQQAPAGTTLKTFLENK